jgi:UDP:flavonoid glycosyltransferase YjiC (YdhE family)
MTRLGVARTLPWRRESTKRLTRELTALLNDRRYRHTAVAVQARLSSEDGLNESIRAVDLALRG